MNKYKLNKALLRTFFTWDVYNLLTLIENIILGISLNRIAKLKKIWFWVIGKFITSRGEEEKTNYFLIRKKDKQFKDKPCCAVTDKNGEKLKSNRKLDIRDNFGLNINYKNATRDVG